MNEETLCAVIDGIDDRFVNEAGKPAAPGAENNARKPARPRWGVLAACLAVLLLAGGVIAGLALESREYRAAAAFFDANGLPKEGLSRYEMKRVYRDVATRRFAYGKTADVLRTAVPGAELPQEDPSPEALAAAWERLQNREGRPTPRDGFVRDYVYKPDDAQGFEVLEKSVITYYRDGEPLWTAEIPQFTAENCAKTKTGAVAWGVNYAENGAQTRAWLALIDDGGSVLWTRFFLHGFKHEHVGAVLENGDGTLAVFTVGDFNELCLTRMDTHGTELASRRTEVGSLGIRNAARLGDGYLVQLTALYPEPVRKLVKLDSDGSVTDTFSYESEDSEYYITDMAEFSGKVYLSAYAVPRQEDPGGRDEIANILKYVWEQKDHGGFISSEELLPVLRDNYTAVLLVCDPDSGAPQTFYSVTGSLGGKLAATAAGELEWDVERPVSAFYSPATSAFTIGGSCAVFRYAFGADGTLLRQTDAGEYTDYYR